MFLKIEKLPEKILVGKAIRMSLAENRTAELWQDFMRNKTRIKNTVGTELYSIQIYDKLHYFEDFNAENEFFKWAAIEVNADNKIPSGLNLLTLEPTMYAVFLHKGLPSEFQKTFQYILRQWLPQSNYQLDDRPHFELLGEKYKNNDPSSEEEVWIPIKKIVL